jgi:MinD-like ATPase involved in chromosome partitioning or flagellar assembly
MVVAVISPNSEAQEVIAAVLERTGRVESVWSLPTYPDPSQLKDLPQDPDGCIVFLDFSDYRSAIAIATEARRLGSSLKLVAMMPEPGLAEELARLGIRHTLGLPLATHEVLRAFMRLAPEAELSVQDFGGSGRIFAFLPARPGAGATTLAVHTAAAVARLSNERTLLLDFDFRLGMTSFLLKLPGKHSVIDALDDIDHAEARWESLINRRDSLDVLGSAPQEFLESNLEQRTTLLLNLAHRRYQTVVVDLPGEMREYEIDTLQRATSCFLVCNSDIGVMHMAQRKADLLRSLALADKTSVIVNRAGGLGMISPRDVEAILKLPVRFSVANAYKEIAVATQAAATLEGRGGVITQIENIARWMMPKPGQTAAEEARAEESSTHKFLEFFTT